MLKGKSKVLVFSCFFALFVGQLSMQGNYLRKMSESDGNLLVLEHLKAMATAPPKVAQLAPMEPEKDEIQALATRLRTNEKNTSSKRETLREKRGASRSKNDTEITLQDNNEAEVGEKKKPTKDYPTRKTRMSTQSQNVTEISLQKDRETDVVTQAFLERNKDLINSLLQKGIYRSRTELLGRSQRFPSVDKRARLYLSSWYTPPCNDNQRVAYNFVHEPGNKVPDDQRLMLVREFPRSQEEPSRTFVLPQRPEYSRLLHGNPATMRKCGTCNHYVPDVVENLLPAWDRSVAKNKTTYEKPLLFFWSDSMKTKGYTDLSLDKMKYQGAPHVPVIMKFRNATSFTGNDDLPYWMTANEYSCRPVSQIPPPVAVVTMLKSKRHYKPIENIPKFDIPWKKKMDAAVWRGSVRGVLNDFKESELHEQTPRERCMLLPRCRLVYNTADSALVNAGLVGNFHEGLVPEDINGKQMYKETMDKRMMLQYKVIIMIEGNDVSTGLKWALFSNSVVLMPTPTRTSWAMEELLEPWVHYIPLSDDLDDVEEKMQWVIDHDKKAEEIARRGSLWMTDMLYHPDAKRDEELIYEEIVSRFQSHFVLDPNLALE